MKLRRFLSCTMALLLVCSLPVSALAAEYDLAQGSVTVNATETGQTVTHGTNDPVSDDAPVIIQSNNETPTSNTITITATENATANVTIQDVNIVVSDDTPKDHSGEAAVSIEVGDNASANLILDDVNINTKNTGGESTDPETYFPVFFPGEAAVQITGNGDVTLELDGKNTLQSGYNRAGVEKNTTDDSGLTITDETGTSGSLKSTGGEFGSGIGGGAWGSGSNIIITGSAEVIATGGNSGSGIGGGAYGTGNNITIEGSAEVTAQGGNAGSGIGGGISGSGSDITIEGSAEVTAQGGNRGSGIGGGAESSGSNITITGSAEVTAKGGLCGSGIGGGYWSTGSNITVSEDAQVKAQGGNIDQNWGDYFSAGAAIGDGGKGQNGSRPDAGQEVPPITDELTANGKIEYYAPGANMETAAPTKTVIGAYGSTQPTKPTRPAQPEEDAPQTAPLYRVIEQDGKAISCQAEQKGGVLTITVDADFATLTGNVSGLKTLKAQGVDTIVFVTNGATSTFAIADLLAQGGDTYKLTHDGKTVTFTLGNGADISKILK